MFYNGIFFKFILSPVKGFVVSNVNQMRVLKIVESSGCCLNFFQNPVHENGKLSIISGMLSTLIYIFQNFTQMNK